MRWDEIRCPSQVKSSQEYLGEGDNASGCEELPQVKSSRVKSSQVHLGEGDDASGCEELVLNA
jgi:hypothetical protein